MAAKRPPMGEAASLWAAAIGPLARKDFAGAKTLATEAQTRAQSAGSTMGKAAAALVLALADFGTKSAGPAGELFGLFQELGVTWGEAAALITAGKAGASAPLSTGSWAKAAAAAGKAEAPGMAAALKLAGDVGLSWMETGAAVTGDDVHLSKTLSGQQLEAVIAKPAATAAKPAKGSALLAASGAHLAKGAAAAGAEAAKEAIAIFKELGDTVSEVTGSIALAKALTSEDSFVPAMQAVSGAVNAFKGLGHKKGEAGALCTVAKINLNKQLPDDAAWKAREALKLYRQLGDRLGEVTALQLEASALLAKQDMAKALQSAQDAVSLAEELGDKLSNGKASVLLAKAHLGQGQDDSALKALKDAMIIAKDLADMSLESTVTDAFVEYYAYKGKLEDGVVQVQMLAEHYRDLGDKAGQAEALLKKAAAQLQDEEYDNGLRSANEALAISKSIQDRKGEGSAYKVQAQLRFAKDDIGDALEAAEQACAIFREVGGKFGRIGFLSCVEVMINSYVSQSAIEFAFQSAVEAMKYFIEKKDKKGEGAMLMALADLSLAINKNDEAMKAIAGAPGAFAAADDRRGEALAKAKLANVCFSKGKAGDSLRAAEDAANLFRTVGDLANLGTMLQLVADSHFMLAGLGMGNGVEALRAGQEAVAIYRQIGDKASEAQMLHTVANAQLMTKNFQDAQTTANACRTEFKALEDKKGEAGALLLVAGSFLGLADFDEAKTSAKEARDIFVAAEDTVGEDSCEDFLDSLKQYEKGDLDSRDFMGFAMRGGDPSSKPRERKKKVASGTGRNQGADIELFSNEQINRDTIRNTVVLFESFESRRATAPGMDAMKKRKGSEAKDLLEPGRGGPGAPSKSQALYVVKWVPDHTLEERGVAFAPGYEKLSEKKMAQTVLPTKAKLEAPKPNFPARLGPSSKHDNLLAALARKHKVATN
jgi:tetratricopeptide (TPR) repeat protein